GVLGVGVHFGAAGEFEADALGERDGVILADIAALGVGILGLIGAPAMLLDPESPAGLQRLEKSAKRGFGLVLRHPVVDVPEGDDEVDRTGWSDLVALAAELGDDHLAVDRRVGRELGG